LGDETLQGCHGEQRTGRIEAFLVRSLLPLATRGIGDPREMLAQLLGGHALVHLVTQEDRVQEGPHQALDMKVPADLYTESTRPYSGLTELELQIINFKHTRPAGSSPSTTVSAKRHRTATIAWIPSFTGHAPNQRYVGNLSVSPCLKTVASALGHEESF
jgi:hypothetical protein